MGTPNFANRTLYHGDNLPFLRGMNSETVHLIATDPPFNKGRDFHATPDSIAAGARFEDRWRWEVDVHQEWVDTIQDDWPALWQVIEAAKVAAGQDMAAFLCWLGVRLLEMHRVLREDGSLYLHCDQTASHWLKAVLDAVFGRKNFRNELIWKRDAPGKGAKRISMQFPRESDTILFYAREGAMFTQPYTELSEKQRKPYRYADVDGRRYKAVQLGDYSADSIARFTAAGLIHTSSSGRQYKKYYLDEAQSTVGSIWTDIPGFGVRTASKERTGYPTQKPLGLYERIIRASSVEGDFVLDPFCGCATTPVAAERLNRQWIGMDIWDKAHDTVIGRLQQEGLAAPDGDTGGRLLTFGEIGYSTVGPVRTDDGDTAAPVLKTTKKRSKEPPGPTMTRAEMIAILIEENGLVCAGCDREFDDPLYLELDHNTPRSDGGLNHISNRLLLCGPCNRIKSNKLTLSGLRAENKRRGRMANQ